MCNSPSWKDHRVHLEQISRAAISAVDPSAAIHVSLSLDGNLLSIGGSEFTLSPKGKIYVVGAGKASAAMGVAVEQILKHKIAKGIIAVPDPPTAQSQKVDYLIGGHPLPTENSIQAGQRIAELMEITTSEDIVIMLISGGGSALLDLPETGISITDLQAINNLLLRSGATIHDINIIRRQLSRLKGGGLARLANPALTVGLILSDVVGDSLADIASGLTVEDPTSAKDALAILEKYGLCLKVPRSVMELLRKKSHGSRSSDPINQDRVWNFLIGNNETAAQSGKAKAQDLGFQTYLVTTSMQGEAADVGRVIAAMLTCIYESRPGQSTPNCVLFGGETTVTVDGSGIGGRNQELALSVALELAGIDGIALMTLATDGVDGPTSAAGAIVTGETLAHSQKIGLCARELLEDNDSHTFFRAIGDTVDLGPTGTNVNDLVIGLIY